ncbi:MAG: hypothetical protein OHK0046_27100 [Anaerolineae bacterium]
MLKRGGLAYIVMIVVCMVLMVPAWAQEDAVGLTEDVIMENPKPNVVQLRVAEDLINDRVYRRVNGAVDIFDAPNGNYKSTLDAGFNFVTVRQFVDGWAEISEGNWVRAEALTEDVSKSPFAGVLLPEEGLVYPMAWILVNVYPSLVPGGDPSEENELLLRYTKVNIFDSVDLEGWRWYQVGVNQWVHQTLVSKVLPIERPEDVDTERWVSVDLYEQVAIAYEGETPVFATLVSSGLPEWSTNEGLFNIYVRYERTIMSGANGQPDFYYLEEVPWTMYFDNDIALHGAYWHDGFGYRRSHGCVNMSITDANWLYGWTSAEFDFEQPDDLGAAVYVYSSDTYR